MSCFVGRALLVVPGHCQSVVLGFAVNDHQRRRLLRFDSLVHCLGDIISVGRLGDVTIEISKVL